MARCYSRRSCEGRRPACRMPGSTSREVIPGSTWKAYLPARSARLFGRTGQSTRGGAIGESATCFVMPSHFEPFGIVYVEAAAAGVPSIGTVELGAPVMRSAQAACWSTRATRRRSSRRWRSCAIQIEPRRWVLELESVRACSPGRLLRSGSHGCLTFLPRQAVGKQAVLAIRMIKDARAVWRQEQAAEMCVEPLSRVLDKRSLSLGFAWL